MLKKILEKSRFTVIIAVIGSLIATLILLGFGIYDIGDLIVKIAKGAIDSKATVLKLIEVVDSLDDLKGKLIGVVIIVLGVIFLGNTAKWTGGTDILYLGGGIAAVIAAITYFLSQKK